MNSSDYRNLRMLSGARFYHVYTKGLEDDVIFRERADYVAGMNYVPVSISGLKIEMLTFVLMSNHFHFVVYGVQAECERFIDHYKSLVSRYVRNKYGIRKLLRAVKTSCSEIDLRNEGLKRIIAYVLNNPVKAGVNCMPQNYEWGTGRCFFTNIAQSSAMRYLSEFGVREQIAMLRSEVKLDASLRVNESGYIDPACYVNSRFVESLFGRARSLEYFLSVSNRSSSDGEGPVVFSDTLVLAGLRELLEKKYEALGVDELSFELKRKLILDIRRQFNSPPKQLARVFKCPLSEIVNILNV
jgi:hypothetical protein